MYGMGIHTTSEDINLFEAGDAYTIILGTPYPDGLVIWLLGALFVFDEFCSQTDRIIV